jgi:hypothetical protein
MIANPTPITAATFAGMWITNLEIFFPTAEKPRGFIGGNLLPYDGSHLLATGGVRVWVGNLAGKRTTDTTLDGVLAALTAECQRQASKTAAVRTIIVMAMSPAQPVVAMILFTDGTYHTIADCFGLASTDATFAGVFMDVMAEVARQAGLEIE